MDTVFVNGLRVYTPNGKTPDFVKLSGVINNKEMSDWLKTQPDEIPFNVKESKGGKWYTAVDTFKK